ncbi:Protoporphyrinogen IX oxidase, aerobic [Staphylococcus aureus]|nr:Protoporphyrinogen IX oxidase, aerobic [Staphylococcus aureus]
MITLKRWIVRTVATVVLAFDEKDIENTYDGTGFVIARTSDTDITACTWTSKKWPFTTPEGKVLIRAYVGKPGDTVVDDHTDNELVSIVRRDLSQMMTFKGDPEFTIVNRLPKVCHSTMLVTFNKLGRFKHILNKHIHDLE